MAAPTHQYLEFHLLANLFLSGFIRDILTNVISQNCSYFVCKKNPLLVKVH